jgi:two-component system NtrC family sensor kinase
MVAAFVLPVVLFSFLAVTDYRHIHRVADERLERTVNILQEHGLKVFETIERGIAETNEIVRSMSDDEIVADEARLHERLRLLTQSPQFKSLWVFDRNGRALVNSLAYPQPPGLNFADRDYFQAHIGNSRDIFVGEVLRPRAPYPGEDFFSVSRARPSPDGMFRGVVQLSIRPSYFEQFFDKLQSAYSGGYAALVRADGALLARHPSLGSDPSRPVSTPLTDAMRNKPWGGFITRVSAVDGIERRLAWKKLPDLPVFVVAGTETGAIRAEWLTIIAGYLAFGLPVTALLMAAIWVALERTRRLYQEEGRRAAAEGALRQAQRMEAIGQLTGGVAHDFNNILMIVKGNVHRLRRELTEPKLVRKLDMIETASQRGENLVRQLLTFSRKQNLSPATIDLAGRVREFRSLLAPSLRGDIEIRIDVPDTIAPVRVDQSELELAVLNLAVNARDAMPEGGKLSIDARCESVVEEAGDDSDNLAPGQYIRITVADTGTGMPPEVVQRAFEPFFTTKAQGKGTGLGLSMVYGLMKQLGGGARIASTQDEGTTLTLYLPAAIQREIEPQPEAARPRFRGGNERILFVEDNDLVRSSVQALLGRLGYDVVPVVDAHKALELLEDDHAFDLLFTDMVLPGGLNGRKLANEVKERWPSIQTLFSSGYTDLDALQVEEGEEPLDLLPKPYRQEELAERIRAILDRKRPG